MLYGARIHDAYVSDYFRTFYTYLNWTECRFDKRVSGARVHTVYV